MRLNSFSLKILYLLIIVFVLFSCKKETFTIDNLYGNTIKVVGHGGMGIASVYPMNSYESVAKCLSLGADGVELDIQMTKDSVLVLFHNQDLSQGTNLKGKISSLLWSEIKNAYFIEYPYLIYAIISLDELLSNINNLHSYHYTFDCKLSAGQENKDAYINALVQIIDKYKLIDNLYIESSDEGFLATMKNKNAGYKLFIYPSSFEDGLKTAMDLNLYGISISTAIVTKEQIQSAHRQGIRVAVWNVHSQSENIKAIKKNPDIIQTDNLTHLLKLLNNN